MPTCCRFRRNENTREYRRAGIPGIAVEYSAGIRPRAESNAINVIHAMIMFFSVPLFRWRVSHAQSRLAALLQTRRAGRTKGVIHTRHGLVALNTKSFGLLAAFLR
jgi:hypothetical protein